MGRSSVRKEEDLTEIILATLRGAKDGRTMNVRTLRKHALMAAYQLSEEDVESDKAAKKQFKKSIQALEASPAKVLSLAQDGNVTLLSLGKTKDKKKKKKRKNEDDEQEETKDTKKKKKRKDDEQETTNSKKASEDEQVVDNEQIITATTVVNKDKNKPCDGNPSGCTRLFIGNLPFAIDDVALESHFKPATTTHIKWISDKETGRFYGSAFVEMEDSQGAALVVTKLNGSKLMGRDIKINYAPSRPGDIWPPTSKVVTGGQAKPKGMASMSSVKPEGCFKLFVGNLSYEIDDDAIFKFFATVDAEIKAVRWISHVETGDFKGVGFVEFWSPEACEKGATLNGKNLLGRPIRIDWSE